MRAGIVPSPTRQCHALAHGPIIPAQQGAFTKLLDSQHFPHLRSFTYYVWLHNTNPDNPDNPDSLSHWVTTSFNSTRQGTICRWSRWSLLLSHHVAALPEADGEPHLSWLGDTFVMGDPWSPRISHACKDSASEMGTTSTPAMVTGPEKRWSEMAHRRTDSMTLCSTLLRAQWEPALNTQVSSCRDRILSSYHTTIMLGDAAWTSQRRCPAFVKRSW